MPPSNDSQCWPVGHAVQPTPQALLLLGHVQAPSEHTEFGDSPLFVQSVQTPLFPHAVWVLGHAVGGHVLLIHSEAPLASSQY